MSLNDILMELFRRDARKFTYLRIDPSRVKGANFNASPMEAGKNYFRLWLNEMYLPRDRDWFKTWYPVVHSIIRFQFGNQTVDIPYIAGPLNLKDVNPSSLDRVIQLNHPLTTLMPFNGGIVDVTTGLLAMQGADYLNRFISVMGNFAKLLAVPQLSTVLSVAGPIMNGIEELFGVSNGDLYLGLHQAFTGSEGGGANGLRPGYMAAILAEEGEVDAGNLWVVDDRLKYGQTAEASTPMKGFAYMLFRIESREQRDDMDGLNSISKPFDDSKTALVNGEIERANTLLKAALAAAMISLDLTKADRFRVPKAMKEEFDQIKQMTTSAGINRDGLERDGLKRAGLEDIRVSSMKRAMQCLMPVDRALEKGEPTFEKIMGES